MTRTLIIMGFFTAITNFFSCSGQTKQESDVMIVTVMEEKKIEPSKDKLLNRHLTEQIIDRTSDKYLLDEIFDHLYSQCSVENKREYDIVLSWNKSKQAVYKVCLLKGEVNNGGYNQFYNNSGVQYYKDLPDALKLIGAHKFADLTKRANDTFEKEYERVTKYQEKFLDDPLAGFDNQFFNLSKTKSLEKLLVNYIRKHKTEFID